MAQQPDTVRIMQDKLTALNRLVEISLILNSTLALQPLLDYLMNAATEISNAEAASILLVDKNTNELFFTAASNASGQGLIGMVVPIEDSIAGRIIEEGRAVIIADAAHEPRHYRQVGEQIGFETRNILGVPMRIRDKLVGVLEVVNKKEGEFGEDDLRHIGILSSQAAVAIENARLVEFD